MRGRRVVAAFDGGTVSSDAGAVLGRMDEAIRLIDRLSECFFGQRKPWSIRNLLKLRVAHRRKRSVAKRGAPGVVEDLSVRLQCGVCEVSAYDACFFMCEERIEDFIAEEQRKRHLLHVPAHVVGEILRLLRPLRRLLLGQAPGH